MRSHSHSHRGRRGWSLTLGDNASSTSHGKRNEAVKTPIGGKETGERLDAHQPLVSQGLKQALKGRALSRFLKRES